MQKDDKQQLIYKQLAIKYGLSVDVVIHLVNLQFKFCKEAIKIGDITPIHLKHFGTLKTKDFKNDKIDHSKKPTIYKRDC